MKIIGALSDRLLSRIVPGVKAAAVAGKCTTTCEVRRPGCSLYWKCVYCGGGKPEQCICHWTCTPS